MNSLLIRTDASTEIGRGHAMRCLAFAQACKDDGGTPIFAMALKDPKLEAHLASEGIETTYLSTQMGSIDDAKETCALARQMDASWLVLDGYYFNAQYQKTVKEADLRLLLVDDVGMSDHCYADIVLNQNLYARDELYKSKEPHAELLLGARYALLRREFLSFGKRKRKSFEPARKILVTLGGSDPQNVTLKVLKALEQLKSNDLEVVVIAGANNPHWEQLKTVVGSLKFPVRLENNVGSIADFMAWADLALSGGGSTCFELAFMGVPSLVIALGENQKLAVESFGKNGSAINLGWYENLSTTKMAEQLYRLMHSLELQTVMAQRGQELVDGEGAARVLMHLNGRAFRIRAGREDDCRLIWNWANDPKVRMASFSKDPISWETHVEWFGSKISNSNCVFYIGVDKEETPIGQVRFDKNGDEAVISVTIDQHYRGRGYSATLIESASNQFFASSPIVRIHAYIKEDNEASQHAFIKGGFKLAGRTIINKQRALCFTLTRNEINAAILRH